MASSTFPAVIVPGLKQPLTLARLPIPAIQPGEIRVRIEWAPSAPLDVYQVEAGLMARFPQSLGDTAAGTVVEVGPDTTLFNVGDRVFGFFFHGEREKAQQVYVTAPQRLFGKVMNAQYLCSRVLAPSDVADELIRSLHRLPMEFRWPLPPRFPTTSAPHFTRFLKKSGLICHGLGQPTSPLKTRGPRF